jgi:hypothetical protein
MDDIRCRVASAEDIPELVEAHRSDDRSSMPSARTTMAAAPMW